jgi:hypothetical protein
MSVRTLAWAQTLTLTIVSVSLGAGMSGCKTATRERSAEQKPRRVDMDKTDQGDEPLRAIEAPMPEPVPPVVEPAPPSAAQLPVAEDFQAETAATIMRANYRNELEALETEVHTDGN